ncbi:MAG: hypothetical protein SOY06_04075 [Prevotella sp.]|nr:hypothetical protein [Bacteroidales bacterium]MDY4229006.1 hypothetical protein [Prevotella sp.]
MRKLISFAALLVALLSTAQAWGATTEADTLSGKRYYNVKKMLLYEKSKENTADVQPELTGDHSSWVHPFARYRALVGRDCTVNDIFTTVGVASWPKGLGKMTNDTLSDYTSYVNGVEVVGVYNPVTSVRDMTRHYAKGTTAGFCIGQEGGSGVLSVKLIKQFTLEFYLEGKKVGAVYGTSGSNFNGVNVSLGSLPGSKNATYNIQAVAPEEFDEVRLVNTGVQVSVVSVLDVHYAYVGEPTLYTLTNKDKTGKTTSKLKDFDDYCSDYELTKSEDVSGPGDLVDADITNSVLGKAVIMIGSTIPLKARTYTSGGESFAPGSVVGFKGVGGSALNLSLFGGGLLIRTWDQNNNEVERFRMDQSVLGLSLIKGGESNLSFITTKSFSGVSIQYVGLLNLDLGGTVFNYAFVEPAPDIDHHCDIDPTPDMNICDDQTTAQLNHNNKVPVTWSVESKPEGSSATIDQNGYVTGMKEGAGSKYTFRATSTDGCYDTVTITKNQGATSKNAAFYEIPITNKNNTNKVFELSDPFPGVTGSLVSISKFEDTENLLDEDLTNYATYVPGLEVAGNVGVVAIQTKDKQTTFRKALGINQDDSIKIGFLVQYRGTGLDLNLLNGYSLKFYLNGNDEPQYSEDLKQANVLNLGLAGSKKIQKVELAAVVPANVDFDQMALLHNGVLGLNGSAISFFYPFYETGEAITMSDDPLACDHTVVSAVVKTDPKAKTPSSGASIDGNLTGIYNTVSVADGIDDLSAIIDDNLTTGVTLGSVASVGGGTKIAVKLGHKADYRQQLAIVMDNNDYQSIFGHKDNKGQGLDPLGVGVGKWMKVETYLDGQPTGDTKTDWNVLGADVLTTKGHNIYVWNPTKQYDEVVITLANVLGVAGVQKIYGIVLQSDIDGDGIPDCKDDDSCNGQIEAVGKPQACLNSDITFTFKGKNGITYKVEAADQTKGLMDATPASKVENDGSVTYTCSVKTTKAGVFSARVLQEKASSLTGYQQDGVIDYVVHPLVSHWNPNTTSTDWNVWSNWIEGSPYACTDVVIPAGAKVYPVLADPHTTNDNSCNGIHFEPGAAVENVFKLRYDSAWVDLALKNGEASLWTAPMGQVYSGDFYASEVGEDKYFTALTDETDPVNFTVRTSPLVYQRVWKASVNGNFTPDSKDLGDVTLISKGTWSHSFNSLTQDYASTEKKVGKTYAPHCFSLMADDNTTSDKSYTIHLPKAGDRSYYYYDAMGEVKGSKQTVSHGTDATKLWSTQHWTTPTKNLTLNYTNNAGTTSDSEAGVFLVGNPLMSHLDVKLFLQNEDNAKVISGIKLYKHNTTYSVVEINDQLVSSANLTDDDRYIVPAGAFFAVAKDNTENTLQVTYDSLMFAGKSVSAQPSSTKVGGNNPLGLLRITAKTELYASGAIVLEGSDAKAATLMDEEYKPSLALFTIDNGRAYDIRPANGDIIELGLCLAKADSVALDFHAEGNADTDGWRLYDRLTGLSYEAGEAPVIFMEGSNVGRFYLSRVGNADNVRGISAASDIYVATAQGKATVTCARHDLRKVEAYNGGGMVLDTAHGNGVGSLSVGIPQGVVIIKATRLDGTTATFKLMAE